MPLLTRTRDQMHRHLSGDEWSAEYERLLPAVLNYFRLRLRFAEEAEDLTSATFERAWRKRHLYDRRRGSTKTWVLAIAARVNASSLRRKPLPQTGIHLEILDDRRPDPAECAELAEERRLLTDAMCSLNDRERSVVGMKFGADATNSTIARAHGISETNVGTILHRAVHKLKTEMQAGVQDEIS